jgi:hypothetical protein
MWEVVALIIDIPYLFYNRHPSVLCPGQYTAPALQIREIDALKAQGYNMCDTITLF